MSKIPAAHRQADTDCHICRASSSSPFPSSLWHLKQQSLSLLTSCCPEPTVTEAMTLLVADWSGCQQCCRWCLCVHVSTEQGKLYLQMFGHIHIIHRVPQNRLGLLVCVLLSASTTVWVQSNSLLPLTVLPLQYITVYWLRPLQFFNRPHMLKPFCGRSAPPLCPITLTA